MKKKRSRIVIVLVTAALTFGGLVAAKGGMHKHHNKYHQCGQVEKAHSNDNKEVQQQKVVEETAIVQKDS